AAESGKAPTPRAERRRERARIAAEARAQRRAERGAYREKTASRSCETAGTKVELPGWYVVKPGDTLWSIAERHYGAGWRYKRIYAANRRHMHSPHRISPCQRVYLPRMKRRA